jgi:hypothetical protein
VEDCVVVEFTIANLDRAAAERLARILRRRSGRKCLDRRSAPKENRDFARR